MSKSKVVPLGVKEADDESVSPTNTRRRQDNIDTVMSSQFDVNEAVPNSLKSSGSPLALHQKIRSPLMTTGISNRAGNTPDTAADVTQSISAVIRRIYRISLFALVCRFTLFSPFFAMYEIFSSTSQLTFQVRSSQIRLIDSNLMFHHISQNKMAEGTNEVSLHVETSISSRCVVTFRNFNGENQVPIFENCDVNAFVSSQLKSPLQLFLTSTTKTPSHVVYTSNRSESSLSSPGHPLNISSLNIYGNFVDINMRSIHVHQSLIVEVGSGDVSLIDVGARDDAALKVSTGDGNVLLLLRQRFHVNFANYDNSFCLSAPVLRIVSEKCDDISNVSFSPGGRSLGIDSKRKTESANISNCRGRLFMEEVNESSSLATYPMLDVSSAGGSLYIAMLPTGNLTFTSITDVRNIINSNSTEANLSKFPTKKTSIMYKQSEGMLSIPRLSKVTESYVESTVSDFFEDSSHAFYSIFNGGVGVGSSPDTRSLLIYLSQRYFGIEPWMLRAFSLNLVGPKVVSAPLRWAQPLPCPLSFHTSRDEPHYNASVNIRTTLDVIHQLEVIREAIDMRMNGMTHGVMAQTVTNLIGFNKVSLNSFGPVMETLNLMFFDRELGATILGPISASNAVTSTILILTSILIASLLAIIGTFATVSALDNIVRHHYSALSCNHIVRHELDADLSLAGVSEGSSAKQHSKRMELGTVQVYFPSAFAAIARNALWKTKQNSLNSFLQSQTSSVALKQSLETNMIPLLDFKKIYHEYCFSNNLQPRELQGPNLLVMKRFGLSKKVLDDQNRTVFIQLRLCNQEELSDRKDNKPLEGETSLSFFMRTCCIASPFDTDYLTFDVVSRAYQHFLRQNMNAKHCRIVPITQSAVIQLGIKSRPKQTKFILICPFKIGRSTLKVDIMPHTKSSHDGTRRHNRECTGLAWDLLEVLEQIFFIGLLTAPLVVFPILSEAMKSAISARPDATQILATDATFWGGPLLLKIIQFRMSHLNTALFLLGVLSMFGYVVEVNIYYLFQPLSIDDLPRFSSISLVRRIHQKFVLLCTITCTFFWIGYIGLFLIWIVLSAILDPYHYLPYGTAVTVLVSVVVINATSKRKIFLRKSGIIRAMIKERFHTAASSTLPMYQSFYRESKFRRKLMRRLMKIQESSALNDALLQQISKPSLEILQFDQLLNIFQTSGRLCGMHEIVFDLVVCMAVRDSAGVLKILCNGTEKGSFGGGLNAKSLQYLYEISCSQREKSSNIAVQNLLIHYVDAAKANTEVLEAITALSSGNISHIIDLMKDEAENCNAKDLSLMSLFLDMVVKSPEFTLQQFKFQSSWVKVMKRATNLPNSIVRGLVDVHNGHLWSTYASEVFDSGMFDIGMKVSKSKESSKSREYVKYASNAAIDLAGLLVGVSKDCSDTMRVYGPGSDSFLRLLKSITGTGVIPKHLLGLLTVARGSVINIAKLANSFGIRENVAISFAHILAEPDCFGNVRIGLPMETVKDDKVIVSSIRWIAQVLKLNPYVYIGMTHIARGLVSDVRSFKPVAKCIKWFSGKLSAQNDSILWHNLIEVLVMVYASKDEKQIRDSVKSLLQNWVLSTDIMKTCLIDFILFSRGIMDPMVFFANAQNGHYGAYLKLPECEYTKFKSRFKWYQQINDVDKDSPHDFSMEDWRDRTADRARQLRYYSSVIWLCQKEQDFSSRIQDNQALTFITEILCMESSLPKTLMRSIQTRNALSLHEVDAIFSFASMSVFKTLSTETKKSVVLNISAIFQLTPDIAENFINLFHQEGQKRFEGFVHIAGAVREDVSSLRILGECILKYSDAAKRALHSSVAMADCMNQPRLLFKVLSRRHESYFGIIANPISDSQGQNDILEFLDQCMPYEQESAVKVGIMGIVKQEVESAIALSSIIGLQNPSILRQALLLYGDPEVSKIFNIVELTMKKSLEIFGKKMKSLSRSKIDCVKSVAALALGQNILITTSNNSKKRHRTSAEILAGTVDISAAMLCGLTEVHKKNSEGVKQQLIQLIHDGYLSFPESVVRGLVGLAIMDEECTKKMAQDLKYNKTLAMGFACLGTATRNHDSYTSLLASYSLKKLCDEMLVDHETIASLLAIAYHDLQVSQTANQFLNSTLLCIDKRTHFFPAIISVYSDDVHAKPDEKTRRVREHLGPLARIYAPSMNTNVAAALVRLVQGDVSTIRTTLGRRLGWSNRECDVVASLVLCAQRDFSLDGKKYMQKKVLGIGASECRDWCFTRNAHVCARIISAVLLMRKEIVYILLSACHGNEDTLEDLANLIDSTTIITDSDVTPMHADQKMPPSRTSPHNEETTTKTTKNKVVKWLRTLGGIKTNNDDPEQGSREALQELRSFKKAKKLLVKVVKKLNEEYIEDDSDTLVDMTTETAHWLIRVCHGDVKFNSWRQLALFVREVRRREAEKMRTPALTMIAVAQMVQVALGDCKHWDYYDVDGSAAIMFWDHLIYDDDEIRNLEDEGVIEPELDFSSIPQDSIFQPLGLHNPGMMNFFTMLATGNADVWTLVNDDGVVSSKICLDTRIVAIFAGIAAHDFRIIRLHLKTLCGMIGMDVDACIFIMSLAMGDFLQASSMAAQTGLEDTKSLSFCVGCSLDLQHVSSLLTQLCSDLGIAEQHPDCISIVSNIVLAASCEANVSSDAWVRLCKILSTSHISSIEKCNSSGVAGIKSGFWIIEALDAMLTRNNRKVRKYLPMLDTLFGLQGSKGGISTKHCKDSGSCMKFLYSILIKDMSVLDSLFKVFDVKDARMRRHLTSVIELFYRKVSWQSLDELEELFANCAKFPQGALTTIHSLLMGNLDSFALGIERLTRQLKEHKFAYFEGLSATLVGISDTNRVVKVDMGVFRNIVDALVPNGSQGSRGLPKSWICELREPKRTALIEFLYASVTGGETGKRTIVSSIGSLGFDVNASIDLMGFVDPDFSRDFAYSTAIDRLVSLMLAREVEQFAEIKTFLNYMLSVLSRGFEGLSYGRTGVCSKLLKATGLILKSEMYPELLDALYLAQADIASFGTRMMSSIPTLLKCFRIFENNTAKRRDLASLLCGIFLLLSPSDSLQAEKTAKIRAKTELGKALQMPPDLVEFCWGLGQQDVESIARFSRQLGPFSTSEAKHIIIATQLMKRTFDRKSNMDEFTFLQNMNSGSDLLASVCEKVFRACVRGSTHMDYRQFRSAIKLLGLNLRDQMLESWFISGDKGGRRLLSLGMFVKLMETKTENIVDTALSFSESNSSTFIYRLFCNATLLICLLLFCLLSWNVLGTSDVFGSVTSTIIILGIGGLVTRYANEGTDEKAVYMKSKSKYLYQRNDDAYNFCVGERAEELTRSDLDRAMMLYNADGN